MGSIGGSLLDSVSKHVAAIVDVGPVAQIREQYAPRAYVEKLIMRMENKQKQLTDEQR